MESKKKKLKRPLTVGNIADKKFKLLNWDGEWEDAFDQPEFIGSWFVWGGSGNGKTSFVLQLIKKLAANNRILFNSLEEGSAYSIQKAYARVGMMEVRKNVLLVSDPIEDLILRLHKRNSPNIIVIDSFQYLQITYKQYLMLASKFPKKLFIIVSHADGKQPAGRPAKSVMFDASLKIYIEGYRAYSKGRYIGKKGYYNIWQEGAIKYWGDN